MKLIIRLIIIIFLTFGYCADILSKETNIPSTEYYGLENLFNSTLGARWHWHNSTQFGPKWFSNLFPCNAPTWQGLECNCTSSGSCNVVEINLHNYGLKGFIPTSISNFVELQSLDLSHNRIIGTIPASIGLLSKLQILRINGTEVKSTIPEELYNATSLTVLNLNGNYLSGTISEKIGQLTKLIRLDLGNNNLVGSIPNGIGNLINIEKIELYHNYLDGSLPEEIYYLQNLRGLFLFFNSIDGTLSENIGNMSSLTNLELYGNAMEGSFPRAIGSLPMISAIVLRSNKFYGTLPEELYNAQTMTVIEIGNNYFSGSISANISNWKNNIIRLLYNNNQMTGSLPDSIGELRVITNIQLNNNQFNGSLPESLYSVYSLTSLTLYFNEFSGTLSNSVGNLTALTSFWIYDNLFTGTIPASIGNCKLFREIYFRYNLFTGTIPVEIYELPRIFLLALDGNLLEGSIDSAISTMKHLTDLKLNNNFFTGHVLEYVGPLQKMTTISLSENDFSGSFTEDYCNMTALTGAYLNNNLFSGTIPACFLDGHLHLADFQVFDNKFTGTLLTNISSIRLHDLLLYQNEFTGPLPQDVNVDVQIFQVYSNDLTGSIPDGLFYTDLNSFQQISLQSNHLTGTLSELIASLELTQYLDISYNLFSGSLPTSISTLSLLQIFFANNNLFSGSLECFSSAQRYLTNINLSNNQFIGVIPEAPFVNGNSTLLSFAAVSNCFTGTIPAAICNATSLTALALDGLHTASSCQESLLPRVSSSYGLNYYTPGTIPFCLFEMNRLNTLHVSGNGFKGALPVDLKLSTSLSDLALSYNQLTSSIPEQIGIVDFDKLDLSFNRLTGVLPTSKRPTTLNSTISYEVNRLSGAIPSEYLEVETISILDGNHFVCQLDRKQLPVHDRQYTFYNCGTSALEHSTYLWLALFLCSICVLFAINFTKCYQNYLQKLIELNQQIAANFESWMRLYENNGNGEIYLYRLYNIATFASFMTRLRLSFLVITLFISIVLIPVNIALSNRYGTYLYKYAWNVASVYLSGLTPAIILLVFFTLFMFWLFGAFYYYLVDFATNKTEMKVNSKDDTGKSSLIRYYKRYIGLLVIATFNFVIVLLINIGYVIVSTRFGSGVVIVTQFLLASFKLIWNDLAIRNLTGLTHKYNSRFDKLTLEEERAWEGKYMTFNTLTMIFNVIVIPCLATAAVSSDCYYDVLFTPESVVSSFTYQTCGTLQTVAQLKISACASIVTYTTTTSYQPPYLYRYQCASTLVTTYAALYVYKFILTAFIQPPFVVLLVRLTRKLDENSKLYQFLRAIVYQVNHDCTYFLSGENRMFYKDRFNLRMIMYLSVFVTFGVIFPPLAVMICVSIFVQSYFTQLSIGRMVEKTAVDSDERRQLLKLIDEDCTNVGVMFKQTVYAVGPGAAFLYGFIIFDTYGDTVGGRHALWMFALMGCVGCLITYAYKLVVMKEPKVIKQVRLYSSRFKIEMSELNKKNAMSTQENGGVDDNVVESVDIS